jgi:arsenate reductase
MASTLVEFVNTRGSALSARIEEQLLWLFRSLRVQVQIRHRVDAADADAFVVLNGERLELAGLAAFPKAELAELLRLRVAKAAGLRTVLFVCTGNAVRSQIAEGLVNHLFHGEWVAFSAGTMPMGIHKETIAVMREIGINLSGRFAKSVELFRDCTFDQVVILCSDAGTRCPVFPYAGEVDHLFFDDPLAADIMAGAILLGFKSQIRALRQQMQKALVAYLEAKG